MKVLRQIIDLTRPYWHRVMAGIFLGVLVSGVTGAIAWLVKFVVDEILAKQEYGYIKAIALGVIALFAVKGALQFAYAYVMKSSAMKLMRDTQNRLHSHIISLPARYFFEETSGILISRVINDVRVLSAVFTEVIQTAVLQIPTVLVLLGIAFYRKWDLTLFTIMLFPFIAVSTRKLGKRVKRRTLEVQRKMSLLTHKLSETITGAKIIKVFNRETYRNEKFIKENQQVYRENMRVIRIKEATKSLIDVATGIGIGLVLWYGAVQVEGGDMTMGDFGSFIAAVYMIFAPVKKLGDAYNYLQEIRAALDRVGQVFSKEPEETGAREIREFREGIRFDRVTFAYGDVKVLSDVNLEIRAGEVIAIVGPSGAGKTTLADLIPRFYDPTEGAIFVDGTDIREMNLADLRNLIGIVSQDVILFNETIRDNIAFGNGKADMDQIRRAAELAFASDFIDKLPDGYETIIGERGLTLSGGQRQRLAIARAILKNPPVLILDEATSSLDTVSEALVQRALEGLMKGRTTIVIAHRLSTIRNADRIVVLEDGRMTSIGTHEELLAGSATYSRLCNQLIDSGVQS